MSLHTDIEWFKRIAADHSVKVKGVVRLGEGQRLSLRTPKPTPQANHFVYTVSHPESGPGDIDHSMGPSAHERVRVDERRYTLTPIPDDVVSITDKGLTRSYGIFGVPGCGKTFMMMKMLHDIVRLGGDDAERRVGGLLLDPKAALGTDVVKALKAAGRDGDLLVINDSYLDATKQAVNILDCALDPFDRGRAVALAAQAAGISAREPYWLQQLGRLCGAALHVLEFVHGIKPTLRDLASTLLGSYVDPRHPDKRRPVLARVLEEGDAHHENGVDGYLRTDYGVARDILTRFLDDAQTGGDRRNHAILLSFIDQSIGEFRRAPFACFSGRPPVGERSLYDAIVEQGKLLLVSVSRRHLGVTRMLTTLVKVLFQQTVLTRLERCRLSPDEQARGLGLTNDVRPLLFLADEYSDVASELPGEPMGDGVFFSQMRQAGCMGLIATQSVNMLAGSALGEQWRSVFGNLSAKIFMRLGDRQTVEEATELVGQYEMHTRSLDHSVSKEGASFSVRHGVQHDVPGLQTRLLTQTLGLGDAVVVGCIDGRSPSEVRFIHVPAKWPEESNGPR